MQIVSKMHQAALQVHSSLKQCLSFPLFQRIEKRKAFLSVSFCERNLCNQTETCEVPACLRDVLMRSDILNSSLCSNILASFVSDTGQKASLATEMTKKRLDKLPLCNLQPSPRKSAL